MRSALRLSRRAAASALAAVPRCCCARLHSASAAASASSAASAAASSAAAPTRLFSFPFGLASAEPTLSAYRSSASLAEAAQQLQSLRESLDTEQHALDLERHLAGKIESAPRRDESESAAYAALAARVDVLAARVETASDSLLVENFDKTFVLYPPTAYAGSSAGPPAVSLRLPLADGLRFRVRWSTSRHAHRRELATFAFHAAITLTPFRVVAARSPDDAPTAEDLTSCTLLDVSEGDASRVDLAAFECARKLYAGPAVSERQWAWFVSFMATHPSDLAFDVISGCLLGSTPKAPPSG